MAYAVQADLNLDAQRLVELTDNSIAPNVIDATLLSTLEVQCETYVNARLAGVSGITVPFTAPIPPIITLITAYLWAYRIYRHREVMDIPQDIKDDYQMALSLLDQIVAGTISVSPPTASTSGVPAVESSCPRGWTDRDLVTG